MKAVEEILNQARERAQALGLPYEGALTPVEAYQLMQQVEEAKLIDVRTQAEWDWVGKIPNSVQIEWNAYPGGQLNPDFISELKQRINQTSIAMFICRSGARSHSAAGAAQNAGYQKSYNVLEGFQGDKDENGHRDSIGGWRHAGLPWVQG